MDHTQLSDLERMYRHGVTLGASHMIIATDSFDYDDYPIYVMPGQNPRSKVPTNGDRVMECYSYALGWELQAREHRANHWEMAGAPAVHVLVAPPMRRPTPPLPQRTGLPIVPGTTIRVTWRDAGAERFAGDMFTRTASMWRGRKTGLEISSIELVDLITDFAVVVGPVMP